MLHDVGYITRPDPGGHALAGARILARQRGFGEAKVRRLLAVLEHHEGYLDMSREDPSPGLVARILHVAEHYDLMVASGADAAPKLTPPAALARMWAGRGSEYDPILLALFAQEMGLYPPGTLVELSDGSAAVVLRAGRSRERFARPVVARLETGKPAGGHAHEDPLAQEEGLSVGRVLDLRSAGPELRSAAEAILRAAVEE
jgi:hypothetical protein